MFAKYVANLLVFNNIKGFYLIESLHLKGKKPNFSPSCSFMKNFSSAEEAQRTARAKGLTLFVPERIICFKS